MFLLFEINLLDIKKNGFVLGEWNPLDQGGTRADSFEYVMHGKIYRVRSWFILKETINLGVIIKEVVSLSNL
jgi:hypothetical protein